MSGNEFVSEIACDKKGNRFQNVFIRLKQSYTWKVASWAKAKSCSSNY